MSYFFHTFFILFLAADARPRTTHPTHRVAHLLPPLDDIRNRVAPRLTGERNLPRTAVFSHPIV